MGAPPPPAEDKRVVKKIYSIGLLATSFEISVCFHDQMWGLEFCPPQAGVA